MAGGSAQKTGEWAQYRGKEMSKLKTIVEVLDSNIQWFQDYYMKVTYEPYNIQRDCLARDDYASGLRLLDLCFASRQGNQRTEDIQAYHHVMNVKTIAQVFELLKNAGSSEQRVMSALKVLNKIKGVGSKIASVYLRMIVTLADTDETRELEPALPVPLDVHLLKFLFSEVKTNKRVEPNRFNIFNESINSANLGLQFDRIGKPKGKFFTIQGKLHKLFMEEKIDRPIVILDNLWVVGHVFCNGARVSRRIACEQCMFGKLKDENGQDICGQQKTKN